MAAPKPKTTKKTNSSSGGKSSSSSKSSAASAAKNAVSSYKNKTSSSSSSGSSGGSKNSSSSNKSSSYYDPNKDYAAAIKNATSTAEKNQLMQERQNKIDAMNSAGTNTNGYTNSIYNNPGNTSSSSYKPATTVSSYKPTTATSSYKPQPTVTPISSYKPTTTVSSYKPQPTITPTAQVQNVQVKPVPTVTPSYTQQDYLYRQQSSIDPLSVQGTYAGDSSMSLPDQQLLRSYQKVYNDAKARGDEDGMDAAHQMAEKLRDNYRYYPTANSNGYGLGENDIGFVRDMAVRTDALGNKYVDQYNRNTVTTIKYDKDGNFVNQHTSGNIAAHDARVAEQMAATDRRLALQGKENNTYAVRIGDAADAGLSAAQLAQKYGNVGDGAGQALYTTTPVTQAIANGESLATQMYGYFDPNLDYAAAIKAETDPAKKTQLIIERQNKLNYLNGTGKNPNGYSNGIYGYGETQNGMGMSSGTGMDTGGYGSYEDILAGLGGNGGYDGGGNGNYDYSYEDFLADFPEYVGLSQEELLAQYNSIAEQMAAQRNAYLEQILAENQAAKDAAQLEFDEIARQAYIARRQGEDALPQQLAALGVSGGGSETANLQLMANYQNNLNQNERTRQQMLSDYALQALNARNAAASDISGYYANAQQNAMNAWQAEQANRNSYNQWAAEYAAAQKQWAASNDLAQKQLAAQLLEAAYNQNMQNQQWQNTLAQQQYEKDIYNQQWQNSLQQQEYEKQQYEQQWQNNLLQQQIQTALQTGDYGKLASLGYDTNYIQKLQQAELEQLALEAAQTRAQINKVNRSVTSGSGGGYPKIDEDKDDEPPAPVFDPKKSDVAPNAEDTENLEVGNEMLGDPEREDGWIKVLGYGRLAFSEIDQMEENGKIKKVPYFVNGEWKAYWVKA